jgi:hypothetical protein
MSRTIRYSDPHRPYEIGMTMTVKGAKAAATMDRLEQCGFAVARSQCATGQNMQLMWLTVAGVLTCRCGDSWACVPASNIHRQSAVPAAHLDQSDRLGVVPVLLDRWHPSRLGGNSPAAGWFRHYLRCAVSSFRTYLLRFTAPYALLTMEPLVAK